MSRLVKGFFACASGRGRRPEFQHFVTQVHQLQLKYMGAIHPDLLVCFVTILMSELYGAGVEHHSQTIIFELISSSSTSPQHVVVFNFLEKY